MMKGQKSYKFVYDMPLTKVCTTCGQVKDLSEYGKQWLLPDGRKKKDAHNDMCRDCDRLRMQKLIDEHPEDVTGGIKEDDDDRVPTIV
jgi:hypothetical protein